LVPSRKDIWLVKVSAIYPTGSVVQDVEEGKPADLGLAGKQQIK